MASITAWIRLEPRAREGSMARSLQAQVRDPLWMLTRQWQVGEFRGEDGGSPVQATMSVESQPLTNYQPGFDPQAAVPLDTHLPLEVHVEREPVTLGLRGSVQLGLTFEQLVRTAGLPETIIHAFRAAYPIEAKVPDTEPPDRVSRQFRALVAGRVTDGVALYAAYKATQAGQTTPNPLPPEAQSPGVPQVLQAFAGYRESLYSEPTHDSAWQREQQEYAFEVTSQVPNQAVSLAAPEFPGGRLDWYDFTLAANGTTAQPTLAPTVATYNFLPIRVTFRGMPDARWWNFEDGQTDFGQLDAEHVDLAKMLVMEFALIYGNAWYEIPLPTQLGTLSRVTLLVVSDTFGQRTFIRPTESLNSPGQRPWSMFKISAGTAHSDFLFFPPTLGLFTDAPALDDVFFLRDEMAAMAWAVEHKVQGAMDAPLDGDESYHQRQDSGTAPGLGTSGQPGPAISYRLETTVPENWIPLVPIQAPDLSLYFRRGTIVRPTPQGLVHIPAHTVLLDPGRPFFVKDQTIPRDGREVKRSFRRTRWSDGSTYVWLARKSDVGSGPGWSGLAFDVIVPTV